MGPAKRAAFIFVGIFICTFMYIAVSPHRSRWVGLRQRSHKVLAMRQIMPTRRSRPISRWPQDEGSGAPASSCTPRREPVDAASNPVWHTGVRAPAAGVDADALVAQYAKETTLAVWDCGKAGEATSEAMARFLAAVYSRARHLLKAAERTRSAATAEAILTYGLGLCWERLRLNGVLLAFNFERRHAERFAPPFPKWVLEAVPEGLYHWLGMYAVKVRGAPARAVVDTVAAVGSGDAAKNSFVETFATAHGAMWQSVLDRSTANAATTSAPALAQSLWAWADSSACVLRGFPCKIGKHRVSCFHGFGHGTYFAGRGKNTGAASGVDFFFDDDGELELGYADSGLFVCEARQHTEEGLTCATGYFHQMTKRGVEFVLGHNDEYIDFGLPGHGESLRAYRRVAESGRGVARAFPLAVFSRWFQASLYAVERRQNRKEKNENKIPGLLPPCEVFGAGGAVAGPTDDGDASVVRAAARIIKACIWASASAGFTRYDAMAYGIDVGFATEKYWPHDVGENAGADSPPTAPKPTTTPQYFDMTGFLPWMAEEDMARVFVSPRRRRRQQQQRQRRQDEAHKPSKCVCLPAGPCQNRRSQAAADAACADAVATAPGAWVSVSRLANARDRCCLLGLAGACTWAGAPPRCAARPPAPLQAPTPALGAAWLKGYAADRTFPAAGWPARDESVHHRPTLRAYCARALTRVACNDPVLKGAAAGAGPDRRPAVTEEARRAKLVCWADAGAKKLPFVQRYFGDAYADTFAACIYGGASTISRFYDSGSISRAMAEQFCADQGFEKGEQAGVAAGQPTSLQQVCVDALKAWDGDDGELRHWGARYLR